MQAFPPINASLRAASCIFYEYHGELCKNIITSQYVYGDQSTLDFGERETGNSNSFLKLIEITPKCRLIMRDLFCRHHFPQCDETLGQPKKRRICRSSCEYVDQVVCKRELALIRDAPALVFDKDMINCSSSKFDSANGGDAPECYQWYDLPGKCNTFIIKSFNDLNKLPSSSGHIILRVLKLFGINRLLCFVPGRDRLHHVVPLPSQVCE